MISNLFKKFILNRGVFAPTHFCATSQMLKLAMLNEGVDMMGGIGFMVSAVHSNDQIDQASEAFARALEALRDEQII